MAGRTVATNFSTPIRKKGKGSLTRSCLLLNSMLHLSLCLQFGNKCGRLITFASSHCAFIIVHDFFHVIIVILVAPALFLFSIIKARSCFFISIITHQTAPKNRHRHSPLPQNHLKFFLYTLIGTILEGKRTLLESSTDLAVSQRRLSERCEAKVNVFLFSSRCRMSRRWCQGLVQEIVPMLMLTR